MHSLSRKSTQSPIIWPLVPVLMAPELDLIDEAQDRDRNRTGESPGRDTVNQRRQHWRGVIIHTSHVVNCYLKSSMNRKVTPAHWHQARKCIQKDNVSLPVGSSSGQNSLLYSWPVILLSKNSSLAWKRPDRDRNVVFVFSTRGDHESNLLKLCPCACGYVPCAVCVMM